MIQLRSFVHQRLFAAAEEILGEVEKTIRSALYEADLQRPKQEPETRRPEQRPAAPLMTNATTREEELLHVTSPQLSLPEESNSSKAEDPGTSETTEVERVVQIDFTIKEEQEEFELKSQTSEVLYSVEEGNGEVDQTATEVSEDMQPVSSDDFDAESEHSGSDEEWVLNKEAGKRIKGQTPGRKSSARSQKDCHVCPTCGKGFRYLPPFVAHVRKHAVTEATMELLNNLQSSHGKTDCDICGKKFSTTWSLKLHSKIHAGVKDFKCQYCDKSFCQKGNLISHLASHARKNFQKPFRKTDCDICGKKFASTCNLKTHLKIHAGIRDFKCLECGKAFFQKAQLISHQRIHSKEKWNCSYADHVCDICGKTFTTVPSLRLHLKIHAGIRDFKCHLCGKAFFQKGNLISHLRTHTGERPYHCDVCGKSFSQKPNLNSHKRIRHAEESVGQSGPESPR